MKRIITLLTITTSLFAACNNSDKSNEVVKAKNQTQITSNDDNVKINISTLAGEVLVKTEKNKLWFEVKDDKGKIIKFFNDSENNKFTTNTDEQPHFTSDEWEELTDKIENAIDSTNISDSQIEKINVFKKLIDLSSE